MLRVLSNRNSLTRSMFFHPCHFYSGNQQIVINDYYDYYKWLLCSDTILSTGQSQWIRKKTPLLGVLGWPVTKCLSLDFSSGYDLEVVRLRPCRDLHWAWGLLEILSLSPSALPCSLGGGRERKEKKKEKKSSVLKHNQDWGAHYLTCSPAIWLIWFKISFSWSTFLSLYALITCWNFVLQTIWQGNEPLTEPSRSLGSAPAYMLRSASERQFTEPLLPWAHWPQGPSNPEDASVSAVR